MKLNQISFLILVVCISSLEAAKIWTRLGHLPETAEIYRFEVDGKKMFFEAQSIPANFRIPLSQSKRFEKVDMGRVKDGQFKTTNDISLYQQAHFAPANANLVQLKQQNLFVDLSSVADSTTLAAIKANSQLFKPVGKAANFSRNELQTIDRELLKQLELLLGPIDLDLKTYGTQKVAKAIADYRKELSDAQGKIIEALDYEIQKFVNKGDLDNTEKYMALKTNFSKTGNDQLFKDESNYKLKTALKKYTQVKNNETESLVRILESEKKDQLIKGNLSTAQLINKFMKTELLLKSDSSSGNYELVIWNTHNYTSKDRGSLECDVTVYRGAKTVFSKKAIALPWENITPYKLMLKGLEFDKVEISITKWKGASGGLAEVQLIKDGKNLCNAQTVSTSHNFDPRFGASDLVDGITKPNELFQGYWILPNATPGKVTIQLPAKQ